MRYHDFAPKLGRNWLTVRVDHIALGTILAMSENAGKVEHKQVKLSDTAFYMFYRFGVTHLKAESPFCPKGRNGDTTELNRESQILVITFGIFFLRLWRIVKTQNRWGTQSPLFFSKW